MTNTLPAETTTTTPPSMTTALSPEHSDTLPKTSTNSDWPYSLEEDTDEEDMIVNEDDEPTTACPYSSEEDTDEEDMIIDEDDEPTNACPYSSEDTDEEDMFTGDEGLSQTTPHHDHSLPFPCFSRSWYQKQGRLTQVNAARKRARQLNPISVDSAGDNVSLKRSPVESSLESNLESLAQCISDLGDQTEKASTLSHLNAVYMVGEYIMQNGPIVATQDVAKVYAHTKGLSRHMDSGELYESVCKYLNTMQIYINGKGWLLQCSGTNAERALLAIASTVDKDNIVRERVRDRLQDVFKSVLEYTDTPRDKQLI